MDVKETEHSQQQQSISDIFNLRKQGRKEEAYEAARRIYAIDKGPYASSAMFWTAVDILKIRTSEGMTDEAKKIYQALERLLTTVKDENGWMTDALKKCQAIIRQDATTCDLSKPLPKHLQTGAWGEEIAAAYLREKGYVILERDWHSGHRDIDIIALHDGSLVFVEVKTRHDNDYAEPESAVNYHKQKNLRLAINHYIKFRHVRSPWRFDVITIIGQIGNSQPEINHIEDFPLI